MAKDISDYTTQDFINLTPHILYGQVLMDRQRHIAIVAKKGPSSFHLVGISSGKLKVRKCTARQITDEWMDAEYPYDKALNHLLNMSRREGTPQAAIALLKGLARHGKEPMQGQLFCN